MNDTNTTPEQAAKNISNLVLTGELSKVLPQLGPFWRSGATRELYAISSHIDAIENAAHSGSQEIDRMCEELLENEDTAVREEIDVLRAGLKLSFKTTLLKWVETFDAI